VLEEETLIGPSSQGAITTDRTADFVADLDGHLDEIGDRLDTMKISATVEAGS
jgi:predicted transcriptional regulator